MKLLILTQLPPTHHGILTLISSINNNFSVEIFFSDDPSSQSLWCYGRRGVWFHALKIGTVKFKTKTAIFYSTSTQNSDISEKVLI